MYKKIKRLTKKLISRTDTGKKLIFTRRLQPYLDEIGWFKSVQERMPVDRNGNCLPWYTYPAISFLTKRIHSDMVVFEYGSGNSTLWWSQRVSDLVSIEHELEWYNYLKNSIASNVNYKYCALEYGGDYCKAITGYKNKFHVIVIDGRDRVNCAMNSLSGLRDDGLIIWDNSDREQYEDGYSYLINNGFRRIDFEGHGPINAYKWCTSIFYRDNNCFGI
ncbi:MAG: FkbM family methyltransferase [Anaerolineales bacterium]|jgi:hypothetical protein